MYRFKNILTALFMLTVFTFTGMNAFGQFDIQGHRGCRGLLPENTIPAFIEAVRLGVNTLEMDVVITGDKHVLVSHDPFISHKICLKPDGSEITVAEEKSYNIFQMTTAEVQQFDCGSKHHPGYPEQKNFKAVKPLLKDVIVAIESYLTEHSLPEIKYNIEIKSTREGDSIFHPSPKEFVSLLYDVIENEKIKSKCIVQSFDLRPLQLLHAEHPEVELALLVENKKSVQSNLSSLGFNPQIYSCYYKLLRKKDIEMLHQKGMKVIPWTVNNTKSMQKLIDFAVDGIITDYPDRLITLIKDQQQ